MDRRNWLDLGRKLVDRFDLDFTLGAIQEAQGDYALSYWGIGVLLTNEYPSPFPVTLSGSVLGGSVGNGIAFDPNGQITRIDSSSSTSKNFLMTAADPTNPRWDLLVLRYKQTGDTPVPKPSDPITTIFLNLHDDFELAVVAGTPAGSPAYPAKGALDIIVCGIKVPANATLGTQCVLDFSVQERSSISASRIIVDTSAFQRVLDASDTNVQLSLNDIDAEVNKFFGQLMLAPHPTNTGRAVITGGDVSMKDGTVRSLVVQNFLIDFAGAQLEFEGVDAGKIFAPDGVTVVGTFVMPVIATSQWRWFAVSILPGALGADNRMGIDVQVKAAAMDGASQAAAVRAEFFSGIPLGQLAILATGVGTVAAITKQAIVLLNPSEESVAAQAEFVQEELGLGDGSTTVFNLSKPPLNNESALFWVNGVQLLPAEFTLVGQVLTLAVAPVVGQTVSAYYIADGESTLSGFQEEPSGTIDGVNNTFLLTGNPANRQSTLVFVDGLPVEVVGWNLIQGATHGSIQFNPGFVPESGQSIYCFYLVDVNSISGMGGGGGGGGGGGAWTTHGTVGAPEIIDPTVGVSAANEDRQLHYVRSQGGNQAVTANPQISNGFAIGQELALVGTSDTNFSTFSNGNGLQLNGPVSLKNGQTITLHWNGSVWSEMNRS